jgi:hypothetical protein
MQKNYWNLRLITPNHHEAQKEYELWSSRGYSSHFSQEDKQVEIKRTGPKKALYSVRTRIKRTIDDKDIK